MPWSVVGPVLEPHLRLATLGQVLDRCASDKIHLIVFRGEVRRASALQEGLLLPQGVNAFLLADRQRVNIDDISVIRAVMLVLDRMDNVRMRAGFGVNPGDKMPLNFNMGKAHFFDPANEMRVA